MKKRILAFTLFIMIATIVFTTSVSTKAKVYINKKNITMNVYQKYVLKLKGTRCKVTWKSSKPKVAKVNKKGVVTALKKGKTTIIGKIKIKKYKCVVIVKNNKGKDEVDVNLSAASPNVNAPKPIQYVTPEPTPKPTQYATPEPTPKPSTGSLNYPQIQSWDVFWECYVSDIGDNYIEIVDKNGAYVYRFSYNSSPLNVFCNAVISLNYPMRHSVDIKGDKMKYSDIHTGDLVDIVYNYWEHSLSSLKACYAINVHKK